MRKECWLILFFCVLAGPAFFLKPKDLAASGKLEVDYPYRAEGAWEYPVQPGTEEWVNLGSAEKRREACQIPQDVLEDMDTAGLLETALNDPFCSDMMAFDRVEDGYRHQLWQNSALSALETRSDRHEVIRARLENMEAWLDEVGRTRSEETSRQYDCLLILEQCMG